MVHEREFCIESIQLTLQTTMGLRAVVLANTTFIITAAAVVNEIVLFAVPPRSIYDI